MSIVGYYRIKISDFAQGEHEVKLLINGIVSSIATVKVREYCSDYKYLKYLDRYGRYRFFPFNEKWQKQVEPKQIGEINNLVTTILNQAPTENIGYKAEQRLTLSAGLVSQEELDKLAEIYTSPRVYLYIGAGTDFETDWLPVTVQGDGVNKKRQNFSKIVLTVNLPKYNAITKI